MALLDITPASMMQVRLGRGGRVVYIDDDVCGIAKQIQEINPDLRLAFNEGGEYFVVYQLVPDGEHLVTTAMELDARLVERVREISAPDYNLAAELEKHEAEVDAEQDRRFSDQVGERAEALAHALRKDRGFTTHRAFVPTEIPNAAH